MHIMSMMLFGRIIADDYHHFFQDDKFNFDIVSFCASHHFAIFLGSSFENNFGIENFNYNQNIRQNKLIYSLSGDFFGNNRTPFMEPIYYPLNEPPTSDLLKKDIKRIKLLFEKILSYNFVIEVELYITFGDAIESDFEKYNLTLEKFDSFIFNKYIERGYIPTIKLRIKK